MASSKRITQATFDDVVKENIDDFEMSPEEAAEDAAKQFESQGVDLSNIILSSVESGNSGTGADRPLTGKILEALRILKDLSSPSSMMALTDDDKQDLLETLRILRRECDISFASRSYAASNGGYDIFVGLVRINRDNPSVLGPVLSAFASFADGQPDIFDSDGFRLLCSVLKDRREGHAILLALRTVRVSCVKHEMNRQSYVNEGVVGSLIRVLKDHRGTVSVTKEACATLKGLVVDDDIRVPFGKFHDHAKAIVEEGALEALFGILDVSDQSDQSIVGEVMATLGRLAVRNEFCQRIVDLGGLKYVSSAMAGHMSNQVMMKQIISMMQAIAGNDDVKVAIVSEGAVPLILQATQKHIRATQVCRAGCSALAAISLRNPANAKVIMDYGAAEVIVQVMAVHPQEAGVQNDACMAVRNLVSREQEHCRLFLEVGAEALVRQAMTITECTDSAKAALRDLGCQVELKELWKGERNPLTVS